MISSGPRQVPGTTATGVAGVMEDTAIWRDYYGKTRSGSRFGLQVRSTLRDKAGPIRRMPRRVPFPDGRSCTYNNTTDGQGSFAAKSRFDSSGYRNSSFGGDPVDWEDSVIFAMVTTKS